MILKSVTILFPSLLYTTPFSQRRLKITLYFAITMNFELCVMNHISVSSQNLQGDIGMLADKIHYLDISQGVA